MCDVYYSVDVLRGAKQLRGRIDEGQVGQVSMTRFDTDAQRVQRTRSCIARSPDDSYVVVFPRREHLFYTQAGRSGYIEPGSYVLVHTEDFYELSCPDNFLNWTLKLPGEALRRRLPNVSDHLSANLRPNKALAGLVLNFARQAARFPGEAASPQSNALSEKVIDLVAMVLASEDGAHGSERRTQHALRQRIVDVIRQDLHDCDLSPQKVADRIGISISYLHRVFAEQGTTVSSYILKQRLAAAHERLLAGGPLLEPITQIAYQVGFKNLSHFSKAFQQQYGVSPSKLRAAGGYSAAADAARRSLN